MKYFIYNLLLLTTQIFSFNPRINYNNGPYKKSEINYLDNKNIKNLEKLFYLRNNKYSPYKNIIYMKF